MKRELREELAKEKVWQEKSGISRVVEDNISLIRALGVAAAVVLTGFSAVRLVKRNLEKKPRFSQTDYLI